MIEIPKNNYNHKIETCHGTAVISIPESTDENDLLHVKESLELIAKYYFKHDISNSDKKAKSIVNVKNDKYHVKMINSNHDIKERYAEKYPILYQEVLEHDKTSTSSWYDLTKEAYDQYKLYINDDEEYILVNKTSDGRDDGWYGGGNKKYHDVFDFASKREYAKIFVDKIAAQKRADILNSTGYNFVVEPKQKSTEDQTDEQTNDQEENMYNCGSFDNGYCYSLGRCLTEKELHVCNYSCYCYVQSQKDKIKTLYDFMETFCNQEDELLVDDTERNLCMIFQLPDKNADEDDWNYLLCEFAKCLEIENYDETNISAVCHVTKCIEDHMDNIRAANLFDADITIDKIMDHMNEITTEGKVTHNWFKQFLKALQ